MEMFLRGVTHSISPHCPSFPRCFPWNSSQMQMPDLYPEPLLKIILIPELQEQITEVASLKNHSQGSQPKY